jgi:hypothetical protein
MGDVTAMKRFDAKFGPELLDEVPSAPGVYRFLDAAGEVLYVGKAKDLRRRLAQYRNAGPSRRGRKPRAIVKEAVSLTWEVLPTELDASLEEVRLIQQLRPRQNVASAFAFLYPFVGLREVGPANLPFCELRLVLSARADLFPEYDHHGVYRSRETVALAFFGLLRLLRHLAHQEPRRVTAAEEARDPHATVLALRRVPRAILLPLSRFLAGLDDALLPDLALRLLEKPSARAKREEVQSDLDALTAFYRDEASLLRQAITATDYATYPVPQTERDPLFLRYRARAGA